MVALILPLRIDLSGLGPGGGPANPLTGADRSKKVCGSLLVRTRIPVQSV